MSGGGGRPAFWIDHDYDVDYSSDGVSRFGVYIRRSSLVASCWDASHDESDRERAEWFAVAAWETATPPVMAPGYVRRQPVIRRAKVARQQDGAPLSGIVDISAPWPALLAQLRGWQDWPAESRDAGYFDPADDGMIAGRRLMLTTVRLEFPLAVDLVNAPLGPRDAAVVAHDVVAALVAAMNAAVTPVIGALL